MRSSMMMGCAGLAAACLLSPDDPDANKGGKPPEPSEPVLTKTKVTMGRALHVWRRDGWVTLHSAERRTGPEPRAGVVTMGFTQNANVTVTIDHTNDHAGLNVLHYSSIPVYEPLNEKQRETLINRGVNVWAEWPPRV